MPTFTFFIWFIAEPVLFYVLVTIEYTERSATTRGSAKGKKHTESKNTVDQIAVLNSSRVQFITAALTAHSLQKVYLPGQTSGPGFKIYWSGSRYCLDTRYHKHWLTSLLQLSGGKGQAPLISDDPDWRTVLAQLQASVNRPRSKLDAVCVHFDLDHMEGFKNRRHVCLFSMYLIWRLYILLGHCCSYSTRYWISGTWFRNACSSCWCIHFRAACCCCCCWWDQGELAMRRAWNMLHSFKFKAHSD